MTKPHDTRCKGETGLAVSGSQKFFGILALIALLVGCAQFSDAPPEEVARARYVSDDEPYVALFTMIRRRNDRGAHTALVVNGSQVAIYDPAGSFEHPNMPERGDVLYGVTPVMKKIYENYHARSTVYVREQRVPVSREFADAVIARMEAQGASSKAFCAINTAEVLRDFPEFAHVPRSFYPSNIMAAFDEVPGVEERLIFAEDEGQNIDLLDDLAPVAGQ